MLASIGGCNDLCVCLWETSSGTLLCRQTLKEDGLDVAFSGDDKYLTTVGKQHFINWNIVRQRLKVTLEAQIPRLGSQAQSLFVAVISGRGTSGSLGATGTYALTGDGKLLHVPANSVDRVVDVKVRSAFAIAVSTTLMAVAAADGLVRLYAARNLQFRATLPRSGRARGVEADNTAPQTPRMTAASELYADAVGVEITSSDAVVIVLYADGTLTAWDVRTLTRITALWSMAGHSACIWALASPQHPEKSSVFATACEDRLVRLWSQPLGAGPNGRATPRQHTVSGPRLLQDITLDAADSSQAGRAEAPVPRVVAFAADASLLAAGDAEGCVTVFRLSERSTQLTRLTSHTAHEGPVTCLRYSPITRSGAHLLVSAGVDGLIHVYDATSEESGILQTMNEHEGYAVTAVAFGDHGRAVISCARDRAIVFRRIQSGIYLPCACTVMPEATLLDAVFCPCNDYLVTCGHEALLRLWDVASGQQLDSIELPDFAAEPATLCATEGSLLCCTHQDGHVSLIDVNTRDVVACVRSHADAVTGAIINPAAAQMLTVAGDACLHVWRLPPALCALATSNSSAALENSAPDLLLHGMRRKADDRVLTARTEMTENVRGPGNLFASENLPEWARKRLKANAAQRAGHPPVRATEAESADAGPLSPLSSSSTLAQRFFGGDPVSPMHHASTLSNVDDSSDAYTPSHRRQSLTTMFKLRAQAMALPPSPCAAVHADDDVSSEAVLRTRGLQAWREQRMPQVEAMLNELQSMPVNLRRSLHQLPLSAADAGKSGNSDSVWERSTLDGESQVSEAPTCLATPASAEACNATTGPEQIQDATLHKSRSEVRSDGALLQEQVTGTSDQPDMSPPEVELSTVSSLTYPSGFNAMVAAQRPHSAAAATPQSRFQLSQGAAHELVAPADTPRSELDSRIPACDSSLSGSVHAPGRRSAAGTPVLRENPGYDLALSAERPHNGAAPTHSDVKRGFVWSHNAAFKNSELEPSPGLHSPTQVPALSEKAPWLVESTVLCGSASQPGALSDGVDPAPDSSAGQRAGAPSASRMAGPACPTAARLRSRCALAAGPGYAEHDSKTPRAPARDLEHGSGSDSDCMPNLDGSGHSGSYAASHRQGRGPGQARDPIVQRAGNGVEGPDAALHGKEAAEGAVEGAENEAASVELPSAPQMFVDAVPSSSERQGPKGDTACSAANLAAMAPGHQVMFVRYESSEGLPVSRRSSAEELKHEASVSTATGSIVAPRTLGHIPQRASISPTPPTDGKAADTERPGTSLLRHSTALTHLATSRPTTSRTTPRQSPESTVSTRPIAAAGARSEQQHQAKPRFKTFGSPGGHPKPPAATSPVAEPRSATSPSSTSPDSGLACEAGARQHSGTTPVSGMPERPGAASALKTIVAAETAAGMAGSANEPGLRSPLQSAATPDSKLVVGSRSTADPLPRKAVPARRHNDSLVRTSGSMTSVRPEQRVPEFMSRDERGCTPPAEASYATNGDAPWTERLQDLHSGVKLACATCSREERPVVARALVGLASELTSLAQQIDFEGELDWRCNGLQDLKEAATMTDEWRPEQKLTDEFMRTLGTYNDSLLMHISECMDSLTQTYVPSQSQGS